MKDATLHQDDSDLEKKRRETEALLQSMGITSEVPAGMFPASGLHMHVFYCLSPEIMERFVYTRLLWMQTAFT